MVASAGREVKKPCLVIYSQTLQARVLTDHLRGRGRQAIKMRAITRPLQDHTPPFSYLTILPA